MDSLSIMDKHCLIKKEISGTRYILNTILLLFTVFSIHFNGAFSFLTPRIIAIFYIVFICNGKRLLNFATIRINKTDLAWFASSLFVLVYAWIIVSLRDVSGDSYAIIDSVLNFFIFVAILPMFADKIFKNAIHFSKCLLYASVIQSIIVIMSFAFLPVRQFLENIQPLELWRYGWRNIGLGIAGAGGSVYLFCGIISAGYLLIKGDRRSLLFIEIFVIFIAIALVGRTGFYSALLLFLYLLFFNAENIKVKVLTNIKMLSITGILIILGYIVLLSIDGVNMQLFNHTFDRLWELFRYGLNSPTLNNINNVDSAIPGLSFETIVGTGIRRGITPSGLVFLHDGGYVQRYASLGIIVCVFSYTTFLTYISRLMKRIPRFEKKYIIFCLLLLLMIEYKEPFIYMLAYPFTLIMISRLSIRDAS